MYKLEKRLLELQDKKYQEFSKTLIPSTAKEKIIGVRVPELRIIAKDLMASKEVDTFMDDLPHKYHDENMLHAILLSKVKNYDEAIKRCEDFLPYVDNWAVCDTMHPIAFKKCPQALIKTVKKWLKSKNTYTIRFGIDVLMTYYLEETFNSEHLELVRNIKSKEYYVNMMRAWYFATAMTKQPKDTFIYLKERRLDEWTHLKTISKCIDSFRIDNKTKEILKKLR